jgi:hypothetical protein
MLLFWRRFVADSAAVAGQALVCAIALLHESSQLSATMLFMACDVSMIAREKRYACRLYIPYRCIA